jgi:alpha-1,3-glucosyltransferase
MVVAAAFAVLWSPFADDFGAVKQVLSRLFPVSRGVFEDKVANFWCSVSPFLKLKETMAVERLFGLCAAATLSAMTPSVLLLLARPSPRMFILSLANTSLAFFFFAFQVHEKNILMPLLPISLLWGHHSVLVTWTTSIACFSMFPLLQRDGLALAYFACMGLLLAGGEWGFWSRLSLFPVVGIHFMLAFVDPPAHLQHLWVLACTVYSFSMFVALFVLLLKLQVQEARLPQ